MIDTRNRLLAVLLPIALALTSCSSGPVEYVSGSLSTPVVDADSVDIPFIVVKHESSYDTYGDELTITFTAFILVNGPDSTYMKMQNVSVTADSNLFPYVGYTSIPLLPDETYVTGSARILNFEAVCDSGFWA